MELKHYHELRLTDALLDYNGGFDKRITPMLPTPVIAAVLAPLVLWRVYSRIKRLRSRQRSHIGRHPIARAFFPLIRAMPGLAALGRPVAFGGLAAGLALGLVPGSIALRKTVFGQAGDGLLAGYYTTYANGLLRWRKREAINGYRR
jgi:hypothetical protein